MSGQVDDRNDTRLYDETGVEPKGFEGWMAVGILGGWWVGYGRHRSSGRLLALWLLFGHASFLK